MDKMHLHKLIYYFFMKLHIKFLHFKQLYGSQMHPKPEGETENGNSRYTGNIVDRCLSFYPFSFWSLWCLSFFDYPFGIFKLFLHTHKKKTEQRQIKKKPNTTQKTKMMSKMDLTKNPGVNPSAHRVSSSCLL
jgi:hypothetical protein